MSLRNKKPMPLKEHIASLICKIDDGEVAAFANAICRAAATGHAVYALGNGGSAALATHIATDLLLISQRAKVHLRAISLTTSTPAITALANDYGFEEVFVRQLKPILQKGDIVLGISTSGRSPNVLRALKFARRRGAICLGFGGETGIPMKGLCHLWLGVPSSDTYVVESVHLSAAHLIRDAVSCKLSI